MTDLELLERAAKAAGITIHEWEVAPGCLRAGVDSEWEPSIDGWWNPLNDDGDALRLAVQLGMNVAVNYTNTVTETSRAGTERCEFHDESDRFAATRRAIVWTAAAMSLRHEAPQSNEQSAPTVNPASLGQSGMNKTAPGFSLRGEKGQP
jgi:hypothetical protein